MHTISVIASLFAAIGFGMTGHRALAADFYASCLVAPTGVIEPPGHTPEAFGRIIRADIEKWARVLKGARTKIN